MPDDPPDAEPTASASRAFRRLRRLQRQLERLASRLSDLQGQIEPVAYAIETIVGSRSATLAGLALPGPCALVTPEAELVLRAEAKAGVSSVDVVAQPDGSFDVAVNGRRAVRLPRLLGALVSVLIVPDPVGPDGFAPWRTKAEVAAALAKLTDHAVSPQSVIHIVHRLRKALHDRGENWFLVQVQRERGIRFAVRCDRS